MQSLGQFSPDQPIDDGVMIAAVQGAFFGSSLPSARIEGLIAASVPREHIKDVADVYRSKWWDYRRLSPGHSFLLFAHHYHKAVKIAARKVMSERARDNRSGSRTQSGSRIQGDGVLGVSLIGQTSEGIWDRDQGHITGMWKATLVADAIGIPYPEFCRLAMRIALERLWKRIPRPSQLYSDKLGAYVLDEWEKLKDERLFLASHPMYAEENYAGLEIQDQYREWLVGHIRKQPDLVTSLMNAVYVKRQLPEALAAQHFPALALTRARLLAT